jgi:hypothetical protein
MRTHHTHRRVRPILQATRNCQRAYRARMRCAPLRTITPRRTALVGSDPSCNPCRRDILRVLQGGKRGLLESRDRRRSSGCRVCNLGHVAVGPGHRRLRSVCGKRIGNSHRHHNQQTLIRAALSIGVAMFRSSSRPATHEKRPQKRSPHRDARVRSILKRTRMGRRTID